MVPSSPRHLLIMHKWNDSACFFIYNQIEIPFPLLILISRLWCTRNHPKTVINNINAIWLLYFGYFHTIEIGYINICYHRSGFSIFYNALLSRWRVLWEPEFLVANRILLYERTSVDNFFFLCLLCKQCGCTDTQATQYNTKSTFVHKTFLYLLIYLYLFGHGAREQVRGISFPRGWWCHVPVFYASQPFSLIFCSLLFRVIYSIYLSTMLIYFDMSNSPFIQRAPLHLRIIGSFFF